MPNVRTNKHNGNYFSLARTAVNDPRLSYKAVGLHAYLMSKHDGWEANEQELIRSHKEGRAAVRAAMDELIQCGYMTRVQIRNAAGRVVDWRLDVYESPADNEHYHEGQPPRVVIETLGGEDGSGDQNTTLPQSENRIVGAKPESDFPQVGNRTRNNNECNNNDLNTPSPARAAPTPAVKAKLPASPEPSAPAPKPVTVRADSPHMPPGLRLPGGYVPAGTGVNPVQVYYERFHYSDPDAHLNRPQEDDLARLCPDLGRLREVITAYSRTNYRRGNIQLILDWYHNGVPSRNQPQARSADRSRRPANVNKFGRVVSQEKGDHDGKPNSSGDAADGNNLAALAARAGISPEAMERIYQQRRNLSPAPAAAAD